MENSLTKIKSFFGRTGNKLGYHEDKQGVTAVEWTMLGLIGLFCFFSFYFIDMESIIDNTVLFVHSITNGQFFDFYKYSIENATADWTANYEIPVYILFALWNLPMIVAGYFTDVHYLDNLYCILWSKLLIAFFVALSAFMVYKIAKLAGLDKKRSLFTTFLFSSSTLILTFTMVIVQMDIIPIFFILLGMYFYMSKKYRGFVIAFAIAIPLKMFAIFVFIPLVLLKTKNVFKIVGYLICGMSVQLICKLLFIKSAEYHYALASNTKSVIARLCAGNIQAGNAEIPLFLLTFMAVCIISYAIKIDNDNRMIRTVCYIPFIIFSSMFVFFPTNTYWVVLIVPFMILSIMLNTKNLKLNLFLEIACSVAYVLYCFCYSTTFTLVKGSFDKMMLNRIFPVKSGMQRQYSSIKSLVQTTGLYNLKNIFFCLFVVCIIALVVINFPRKNITEIGNREKIEYSVIWCRFAALAVILGLLCFSYLKTVNKPIIDTTRKATITSSVNVADENTIISQSFIPEKDVKINELTLKFDNNATNRKNMGSVTVKVKDDSGKQLYSSVTGTSLIPDEKAYRMSLKNVTLKANKTYKIEITGEKNNNSGATNVYVTEGESSKYPAAEVNGVQQNYSIYVKLR